MLLKEAIESFLLACRADGLSARTFETYDTRLTRLRVRLGNREVNSLTVDELRLYASSLRDENLSTHTIHGHIRALRRLFTWLKNEAHISENPALRIRLPKLPAQPPKAITENDARGLLGAADEQHEWERTRDRAFVLFLSDTGARLGGVAGLHLGDLNLDAGWAKVTEKGEQWRFVFLKPPTVKAMRAWLEVRARGAIKESGDAVWVSARKRTPMTAGGLAQILKRLKKLASVNGPAGAHSFRHRFAVAYLMNGGDLATLADLLGHSDVETTKKYYARFQFAELQKKHDLHSPVDALLM